MNPSWQASEKKRSQKNDHPRGDTHMPQLYRVELEANDLGQILDGLRCREESWRNTAIYLRDEYFPDDSFVCEECSSPEEAESIADWNQRIIETLTRQRDEQGNAKSATDERTAYLHGKADGQDNLIVRIQANWNRLRPLPETAIMAELRRFTDQIYDE
jgi:hypothetical protein